MMDTMDSALGPIGLSEVQFFRVVPPKGTVVWLK